MSLNGFSVGKDVTLTIVTDTGPLPLLQLTSFKSKQETTKVKSKGIDGITRFVVFPDGWTGTFMVDRRNSNVDDYFAQIEADYYNGVQHQPASITETITEVSGAVTQYRYTRVVLEFPNAGEWAGDKLVQQEITFSAEKRLKIA